MSSAPVNTPHERPTTDRPPLGDRERERDTREPDRRGAAGERDQSDQEEAQRERPASEPRCLFAELLGTFALTTVAAGAEVVSVLSQGEVSAAARAVAPGMLIMVMIYAIGDVSGAHFNPAVTLAFAVRRDFPWRRVPGYWIAQLAGALLAAALLQALFGPLKRLGPEYPHHHVVVALVVEIVLTVLLVTVILGTATGHRVVGPNAGIAVGATIALDGLFAGPISGASMNPARSLGPAIVTGRLADAWIYLAGPAVGALLAVLFMWLIHGPPNPHEAKTATGNSKSA